MFTPLVDCVNQAYSFSMNFIMKNGSGVKFTLFVKRSVHCSRAALIWKTSPLSNSSTWLAAVAVLLLLLPTTVHAQPYTTIVNFGSVANDGMGPEAGLTLAGSTFYGTTVEGGNFGSGSVFAIHTNGTSYSTLYSFGSIANDGYKPLADLTVAGSTLYGTTSGGGNFGNGSIFAIHTNGTSYSTLYSFGSNATDGIAPEAGLTLAGSTLYGTTVEGGGNYAGTIFALPISGVGQTATITVRMNPHDGGTVNGGGIYLVGLSQQIAANAKTGWTFTGWNDGTTQTPRPITVPSGGATYTANFASATAMVAKPTIMPSGGTFTNSVPVTLSCPTAGATVRYTTNGVPPTSSSAIYNNRAITLTNSETLEAKAFRGGTASEIATAVFMIIPPSPLMIVTTSLVNGIAGAPYTGGTLRATGGTSPYKWSLLPGRTLPAGLTLNATTGIIAGKPTHATMTPSTFTVKVTDAKKQFVAQLLALTVN